MTKNILFILFAFIIVFSNVSAKEKAAKIIFPDTLAIKIKQINILDSVGNKTYTVKIRYPEIQGYKNEKALLKMNKYIYSKLDSIILSYKNQLEKQGRKETDKQKNELLVATTITFNSHELLSLRIDCYPGFAGYSENMAYYSAINYDLKKGSEFYLKDIFKKNSDYLHPISNYCIKDMNGQAVKHNSVPNEQRKITFFGGMDPDWLLDFSKESWVQPTEDNYKFFYLSDNGIIFNFVSNLIQGFYPGKPDEVLVPYSQLKDLINPKGPVGFELEKLK